MAHRNVLKRARDHVVARVDGEVREDLVRFWGLDVTLDQVIEVADQQFATLDLAYGPQERDAARVVFRAAAVEFVTFGRVATQMLAEKHDRD